VCISSNYSPSHSSPFVCSTGIDMHRVGGDIEAWKLRQIGARCSPRLTVNSHTESPRGNTSKKGAALGEAA